MRALFVAFVSSAFAIAAFASGNGAPKKNETAQGSLSGVEALARDLEFAPRFAEHDPHGAVFALYGGPSQGFLGSAVRICTRSEEYLRMDNNGIWMLHADFLRREVFKNAPADREYFVTAAHVVENYLKDPVRFDEGGARHDLRLEFVESTADLALFSRPRSSGACHALAFNLSAAMSYDAQATFAVAPVEIELEAPRVDAGRPGPVRVWRGSTRVTSTLGGGLPGRDNAGTMLSILASAKPGQSGSAILAQPEISGALYPTHGSPAMTRNVTMANSPYRRMIGMVLAVGREGTRVAALPAPFIYRALHLYFAAPSAASKSPTQVTARGATYYPGIDAIHFRSWILDAGTGDLGDGGTGDLGDGGTGDLGDGGTGDLGDGGTGDLGDGGTGDLGDGGTGDLGDGGVGPIFDRVREKLLKPRSSGLYWRHKLWLSLGAWTEYESLPAPLRPQLAPGANEPPGIYLQRGKLWANVPDIRIPPFLTLPNKYEGPEFSTAYMWAFEDHQEAAFGPMMDTTTADSCQRTIGLLGAEGAATRRGVMVVYCELETPGEGRDFFFGLLDDRKSSHKSQYYYGWARPSRCERAPCPVELDVLDISNAPWMRDYRYGSGTPELTWRLIVQNYARQELQGGGLPRLQLNENERGAVTRLKPDGLRVFRGAGKTLALFQTGGYRLRFTEGGKVYNLIGPGFMTKNFFVQNPQLLTYPDLY